MRFLSRVLAWLAFGLWLVPAAAQPDTVTAILEGMTLEQRVGQMFVMSFYGPTLNDAARTLVMSAQPGALVLLPSNLESPQQITRLTNDIQQSIQESGGVPAFIAVDQEGGIIAHLDAGFTRWPVPTLLTATQDTDLAYQFGEAVAAEMLAVGINMNLAPVADLLTNRENPIIGRRSFGSYPEQVAPIVAAVIEGMQNRGAMATAKHFPGHGDTDADSHLTLPVISYSQGELEARELVPFRAAITADSGAVMVAHIAFPALQVDDTVPASLSHEVVTGLLRDELEYDGLIITDALDMDAIDTAFSPDEAAVQAILAGNDMVLIGAHISPQRQEEALQAVVEAVRQGVISESQIDESVRRILNAKLRFGVLNWELLEPSTADNRIQASVHDMLVSEMFESGITLVHGADMVPLNGQVVFIYPASRPGLWEACERGEWQPIGVSIYPTETEIAWAEQAARGADQIVVFTQNVASNPQQQRLVAALPPHETLVVALWSPFDLLDLPHVGGYMVTYSPLQHANAAICAILLGERNAQGTLSVDLEP